MPSETASASWKAFSGSPVTFSPAALPREPALPRSASLTKCGSTSYSTLILRAASRAISSVVAATAATSCALPLDFLAGLGDHVDGLARRPSSRRRWYRWW